MNLSPEYHAREARALPSDQLGAREETPAPTGPELVPATVVRAFCCGREVRRNEALRISFCEVCGYRGAFRFVVMRPGQTRLGGT